jgi:hypothetical protein
MLCFVFVTGVNQFHRYRNIPGDSVRMRHVIVVFLRTQFRNCFITGFYSNNTYTQHTQNYHMRPRDKQSLALCPRRMIDRFPAGYEILFQNAQTECGAHAASYLTGIGGGGAVQLTTHLLLVPKLRMTGTTLYFPRIICIYAV